MQNSFSNSIKWSAIGRGASILLDFVFGVIIARILLPNDFGTIAVLMAFITFLTIFVNSGFSQALVRAKEVSELDLNTIFYFNLFISLIIYLLIYLASPRIALFFDDRNYEFYLKSLSLTIILSSLILVEQSIIIRKLDFKSLSLITIFSTLISSLTAIILAYFGFGIWSLIIKTILKDLCTVILTYFKTKWIPSFRFSFHSLKKYLSFGIFMLGSAIIGNIYNNIFTLAIGKMFSTSTLGFYNRAEMLKNTLSQNIDSVISSVSYPIMSKIQDDNESFVNYYLKILQMSFYVATILMLILMFNSKEVILLLLGQKWYGSIIFMKYLCIIGIFFPLNSITINTISITGRSKIYFYFQLLTTLASMLSLILGFKFGIETMLLVFALISLIAALVTFIVFSKIFNCELSRIIKSISHTFQLSIIIIGLLFLFKVFDFGLILNLIMRCSIILFSIIIFGHFTNSNEFNYFANFIKRRIKYIFR